MPNLDNISSDVLIKEIERRKKIKIILICCI